MTTCSVYGSRGRSAKVGGAAAEDRVELGVELRLDLGVLRQQVPGPGQGVGRGLVAGHEEGHRLVAELAVGHPPAVVLVLGVQEHREQVAPVLAAWRGARR